MPYATEEEIIAAIQQRGVNTDALSGYVSDAIDAAAQLIDLYTNREDGYEADSSASAREFVGSGRDWQRIDECVEITLVEVKENLTDTTYTSWAATDWQAFSGDPARPDWNHLPYDGIMILISGSESHFPAGRVGSTERGWEPKSFDTERSYRGQPTVRITAKWGNSVAVPAAIKQATVMQASRWLERGESGFSDALAAGDAGVLMFRKGLDPDVKAILDNAFYEPSI